LAGAGRAGRRVVRFVAGFRAARFFVARLAVLFVAFLAGRRLAVRFLAGFRAARFFVTFLAAFLAGRRLAALPGGVRLVALRFIVRFFAGFRARRFGAAFRLVAFFVALRAGRRFAGIGRPPRSGKIRKILPRGSQAWVECEARPGRIAAPGVTLRAVTELRDRPASMRSASTRPPADAGRLAHWRFALATGNLPDGSVDGVTRWLVLVRASVLPMTVTAGLFAGLLAWWNAEDRLDVGLWVLAAVGIVLAHMANNLMNDLFDLEVGTDSEQYPRALYAPHPVLSGMTTRMGLAVRALVVNGIDLAILVVLVLARDPWILAFALGGFALSVAYTAPPLRLKKRGLGEPTVLAVWGPLMVGGTYYAAVGSLPWEVVVASIPYALLCTAVLMGKHIDKIPWDEPDGTRTLPVVLGERRARALTRLMMVAFYPLVGLLVALGTLPIFSLLCLVGLTRLVRVWKPFSSPKPDEPPPGFPIWPLWFAGLAFVHTRRAGGFLVLGMLIGVIAGI